MAWLDVASHPPELGVLRPLVGTLGRCDPHAVWACASRFSGFKTLVTEGGERAVPVMVEIDAQASAAGRSALCDAVDAPPWYRDQALRFVTGRVAASALPTLFDQPGVARWRIGLPQVPQRSEPLDALATDVAAFAARAEAPAPSSLPMLPLLPLVAVIDHGIAFAHCAFRRHDDPRRTRLIALWDQRAGAAARGGHTPRSTDGPTPRYGRVISGAAIDATLAATRGDERKVYRAWQYQPAQHRASHGTHVLDLAAGYPNPLAPRGGAFAEWDGCAGRAPIVAVQLPHRPNKDTSGCGLGVQVLDALHFIAAHAQQRTTIVNLSDGAYGGPHDGESMNEAAIDDFLDRHPRLHLVVAAGNAGRLALHARGAVPLAPSARQRIAWQVLPGDATDSFCEVWFDQPLPPGAVELTLRPPQGHERIVVPLGQTRVWRPPGSAHARAAVVSTTDSANRPGRSAFLIALGATTRSASGAGVPHGRWQLEVANLQPAAELRVQVWAERDQRVASDPGPDRQSRLVEVPGGGMVVERSRTLSSLAGSAQAFVVGGRFRRGRTRCDHGLPTDEPCYVSHGPRRPDRAGVDAVAPCEDSPVLHGLRAAANRSGATVRLAGTSVAAPIVTRRLLNLAAAGHHDRQALRRALGADGERPAQVTPGQEPAGSPCAPSRGLTSAPAAA